MLFDLEANRQINWCVCVVDIHNDRKFKAYAKHTFFYFYFYFIQFHSLCLFSRLFVFQSIVSFKRHKKKWNIKKKKKISMIFGTSIAIFIDIVTVNFHNEIKSNSKWEQKEKKNKTKIKIRNGKITTFPFLLVFSVVSFFSFKLKLFICKWKCFLEIENNRDNTRCYWFLSNQFIIIKRYRKKERKNKYKTHIHTQTTT